MKKAVNNDAPNIFLINDIEITVKYGIQELTKFKSLYLNKLKEIDEDISLMVYLFVYSIFEAKLIEIIEYFCLSFLGKTSKLKNKKSSLDVDVNLIITNRSSIDYFLTSDYVKSIINTLPSKPAELIKSLKAVTDCKFPELNMTSLNKIYDLRNTITHENFRRKYSRISNKGYNENIVSISSSDLNNMIDLVIKSLDIIKIEILTKYKNYTIKKLINDSWDFCFQSSPIENIFVVSDDYGVSIDFDVLESNFRYACSSQKYMLILWITQYNPSILDKYIKFNQIPQLVNFSSDTMKKVYYIYRLFLERPYLINHFA